MEDDDFFDDDFPDLNEDTLQALEQSALASAQSRKAPPSTTAQGLNRLVNNATKPGSRNGPSNLPWRPPQSRAPSQRNSQTFPSRAVMPHLGAADPPSSDRGLDEENVVDLNEQTRNGTGVRSVAYQRTLPSRLGTRAAPDDETRAAFAAADAEIRQSQSRSAQTDHGPAMDVTALRARIAALESEQERLKHSEQEARELVQSKQGEIKIVRSKLESSTKIYEGRIAALQKQHLDTAVKHKAELEAGQKEREQIQTDNRFLQHDLAQETERGKRTSVPIRSHTNLPSGRNETPRKSKKAGSGRGDGFDDDEVHTISPSKSKDRSREHTPKAGIKRKRTEQGSPVHLSFTQAPTYRREDSMQINGSFSSAMVTDHRKIASQDYQRLLDHRPYEWHDRTIESFAKHAFPSRPDKSLAAIFVDKVARAALPELKSFPIKISLILLSLWSMCLDEKYFGPFYMILDMLQSILGDERASVSSDLIEEALPLCIKTIDLIAIDSAASSMYGPEYVAGVDAETRAKLMEHVDVEEVLDFMHDLCQAAALVPERLLVFWGLVEHDFMLIMLNQAHSTAQITTSLRMLSTSATESSFGCISGDPSRQIRHENDVVNKITSLLFEAPIPQKDRPPYTVEDITELRIQVLNVFRSMCQTRYGGLLLAQHRSAIGRLVRFLEGQVRKLYSTLPSIGLPETLPNAQAHTLVVKTINMTTRLLYHLLRTYDGSIDIVQKLRVVLGGYHKFVVSLSRIAFSDQIAFEAGIEDSTAEAAHAILDHVLGPDDGEAIMKAVETPRSGIAPILRQTNQRGRSESQSEAG